MAPTYSYGQEMVSVFFAIKKNIESSSCSSVLSAIGMLLKLCF